MAFGDSAEDKVIITKWTRSCRALYIFFHSLSQREKNNGIQIEKDNEEKFLFKKYARSAGCVFSMLYDQGIFERTSPLDFIEEHFAFMDWREDKNHRLVYGDFITKSDDEIEDIVEVWKSEWVEFTESKFFKSKSDYLKHQKKDDKKGGDVKKKPNYETVDKRFRKILKDMYDCIEYKCNTGKLVEQYRKRYGRDEPLVRTAECSPSDEPCTDSDEELNEAHDEKPDEKPDEEHGLERRIEQHTDVCVKVINALIAKGFYHNPRN
jgi:hypothetical protein